IGKAPSERPAFQPYRGKPAVRNDRGDRGDVGIIRSPVRASVLPQPLACTSISSVVVVSAPTRRTTYLKLPSFRSRAACQVVRSSSAKSLSSQNTLESQGFRRMFKRYLFGTTFASSSPLTPARQSGLRVSSFGRRDDHGRTRGYQR